MASNPEALLAAASPLGEGPTEEDWRNAVSRAYYAAFHRCRLLVQGSSVPLPDGASVHRTLVDTMTDPLNGGTAFTSLGYILDQCRRHRVAADYAIDADFPQHLAHEVLQDCRNILDRADALH